ncbi:MAG: TldD/PmbA family protein [Bdellovibrionaceae bacterium]|jgi:predicted Zn-dependent protease|nr:TldD/PmbA family protein [Pseudobdellovibrionaceae bacterium]
MDIAKLQKLLTQLKNHSDWLGLRFYSKDMNRMAVRNENPENNFRRMSAGIMVEVLKDGAFANFGTCQMDLSSVQSAVNEAEAKAELYAKYKLFHFTEEQRPKAVGEYSSSVVKDWKTLSQGDLNQLLVETCKKIKVSDKIVSRRAEAEFTELQYLFVSSNGTELSQNLKFTGTFVEATAKEGVQTQTRTDSGFRGKMYQSGFENFNKDEYFKVADHVAKEALELIAAENCPEGKMDLVLSPDQMMLQIHESIGHPLELDRILGDERNYAGSSFVKLSDFGKMQYGSSLLNVTFDPTVKHQLASYGYDDSGLKAEKEFLIKNGQLVKGLGGLESQARSGVEGVANFRAKSWNRAPIDRMANLNIEPGESTVDEIIGAVKKGIYMESNRSWSIDDYRNKFQFGCEYGRLIENGKLTKIVKNPNYRGVSSSFWKSLTMVGNQDSFKAFGTPYCGKGEPNQSIWVGHASPVCMFNDVEVFGG